jgi:alkylhydroperoxidase family enzyme
VRGKDVRTPPGLLALHASAALTDATWEALRRELDEAAAMEVILLAGFYRMLAGLLNTVKVEREPDVPGWPTQDVR